MEEQKLNIKITPEIASGTYANLAIIAHSQSEFIIDFVRMMPNLDQAQVQSRIIVTPDQAKKLLFALQNNIAQYENQYGPINVQPIKGSTLPLSFGSGEA